MAKQLIGIVSSCNEKVGCAACPGLAPACAQGWVSLSCYLFFYLYLCWWKQSADAGVISMEVCRSGWNLHVLVRDGFIPFWIILPMSLASLPGGEVCVGCESWAAQTDSWEQISSFLGWDSGQTLPTGVLPVWACLVWFEDGLLISFDLRRMWVPLLPLLGEHQLHLQLERCGSPGHQFSLGHTSVTAFLCSLPVAAEMLVSPLLLPALLLPSQEL